MAVQFRIRIWEVGLADAQSIQVAARWHRTTCAENLEAHRLLWNEHRHQGRAAFGKARHDVRTVCFRWHAAVVAVRRRLRRRTCSTQRMDAIVLGTIVRSRMLIHAGVHLRRRPHRGHGCEAKR
jgi:hypothetical protein